MSQPYLHSIAASIAVLLLAASPTMGAVDAFAELQGTSAALQGDLAGKGDLMALQVKESQDGRTTTGLAFRLDAETLRMEHESRPVVRAAQTNVDGDLQTQAHTYTNARVLSVASLADHELTLLPSGTSPAVGVRAASMHLLPAPTTPVTVKHFVDRDRDPLHTTPGPSVHVAGIDDGTIKIHGDFTMVLWSWTFLLEQGDTTHQYHTGYHPSESLTAPVTGTRVAHGTVSQAYLRATNATLTLLPDDGQDVGLRLSAASVQGIEALHVPSAAGRIGVSHVVGEDVEISGQGIAVGFDTDKKRLLGLTVVGDGASVRVGDGTTPFASLLPPSQAWSSPWVAVASLFVGAAAASLVAWHISRTPGWRLRMAGRLARFGLVAPACFLLRRYLYDEPYCPIGLTMLAGLEKRRGRLQAELDVRRRADEILVADERKHNARRVLHLFGELGMGDEALEWFEKCLVTDPGLIQVVLAAPVFEAFASSGSLRARARDALGWDDPTGA